MALVITLVSVPLRLKAQLNCDIHSNGIDECYFFFAALNKFKIEHTPNKATYTEWLLYILWL